MAAPQEPLERVDVGGQAVPEGVMMRGPDRWAVAVRTLDGTIALRVGDVRSVTERLQRIPVLRGAINLVATVALGLRCTLWAATMTAPSERQPTKRGLAVTVAASLSVGVAIFVVAPALSAKYLVDPGTDLFGFTMVEAAFKLAVLVSYLGVMGRRDDIGRLFAYHGAEHQAVAAYEAGVPLEAAATNVMDIRHPRCGTSFLLVVIATSVVVHAALGDLSGWALGLSRIAVLPIVAGIAYEAIKKASTQLERRWVRMVLAPGLALQRLTTRHPSEDQVEVALVALQAAISTHEQELVGSIAA